MAGPWDQQADLLRGQMQVILKNCTRTYIRYQPVFPVVHGHPEGGRPGATRTDGPPTLWGWRWAHRGKLECLGEGVRGRGGNKPAYFQRAENSTMTAPLFGFHAVHLGAEPGESRLMILAALLQSGHVSLSDSGALGGGASDLAGVDH